MSQSLPRFRRFEEHQADIARLATIVDGGSTIARARGTRLVSHRSSEGDPLRLRGLPMIARGIPGTSPGTDPLAALVRHDSVR